MLDIKTRWLDKPDPILFIDRHSKRSLEVLLRLLRGKGGPDAFSSCVQQATRRSFWGEG